MALTAGLGIALALALASPAAAAFPGTNGRIAYEQSVTGMSPLEQPITSIELFSSAPDGSDPRQLTNSPPNDSHDVAYSADGKRIVFVSDRDSDGNNEIWTANADGSDQRQITNTGEGVDNKDPYWSPDGTRIVFMSDRDGNSEIYSMNADGSNPLRLTDNPADDDEPEYSPDGTRIVFTTDRDPGFGGSGNDEIYTMRTDGTDLQRVTNTVPADDVTDDQANWSPDGTRLVFTRKASAWLGAEIWTVNADGSNPQQVSNFATDPVNNPNNRDFNDSQPAWSPDGTKIVFHRTPGDPPPTGPVLTAVAADDHGVYTMNADGSNVTRITDPSVAAEEPDWQPIPRVVPTVTPPATSPARRDTQRPRVSVASVRGCVSSSRVRVPVRVNEPVRSVVVLLDGRRIRTTRTARFVVVINARRLRSGRHRLRVVAFDRAGNRRSVSRVFARCAQARPVTPHFTG